MNRFIRMIEQKPSMTLKPHRLEPSSAAKPTSARPQRPHSSKSSLPLDDTLVVQNGDDEADAEAEEVVLPAHLMAEVEAFEANQKQQFSAFTAKLPPPPPRRAANLQRLGFASDADGLPLPWAWQQALAHRARAQQQQSPSSSTSPENGQAATANLVAPSLLSTATSLDAANIKSGNHIDVGGHAGAESWDSEGGVWPDLLGNFSPAQRRLLDQWLPLLRDELHEQLNALTLLPDDLSAISTPSVASSSSSSGSDTEPPAPPSVPSVPSVGELWSQACGDEAELRQLFSSDLGSQRGVALPRQGDAPRPIQHVDFGQQPHDQHLLAFLSMSSETCFPYLPCVH